MTSITNAQLGLAASGLVIWGYGVRSAIEEATWLGAAMLAGAAVLRLFKRRGHDADPGAAG